MLEINNLTKDIRGNLVLSNISLRLEYGKIYGLVGRNGSGKTMLLKHILGFVKPTAGTIVFDDKWLGVDMDIPDDVGAIIETPGFLPEFSGYRNLYFLARIRKKIGRAEIEQAMRTVGLDPRSPKHVSAYSLGMRQRLGIAQALMEDPRILLLDEPMNGLDNDGVEDIRKVLLAQKEAGKLILLASHNKEDIALLCDEVYHMDKGAIMG